MEENLFKEIDDLLEKAIDQSKDLSDLMSEIDANADSFIKIRQIDPSEKQGEDQNKAQADGMADGEKWIKSEDVRTKDAIESRFKALKQAALNRGRNRNIPEGYRVTINSGKEKLRDELNSLRKNYYDLFEDLVKKSLGLSNLDKFLKSQISLDILGIMADFALRKEGQYHPDLILGLDQLSQDSSLLRKIVDKVIGLL